MLQHQGFGRQNCVLLAVLCGQFAHTRRGESKNRSPYPFPELVSSGRLVVQTLINPMVDRFSEAQKLVQPNILYFQGEQLENEERIGSLVWGAVDVSDPETLTLLISPPLPTIVYLEMPSGERIAQAFHSKGVPYVIYWKSAFSSYAASYFRQALLSVVQSSCSHTWDAFQLAYASFRLYCARNDQVLLDSNQKLSGKLAPHLLGDAPKINIPMPKRDLGEDGEEAAAAEGSNAALPSVKIFDDDVDLRFLVCGLPCTLDACLLGSLEDGLNALLNIEIRGSKLQNRVSAAPPPLQAVTFSRGVVTMRCDITTCSSAHISLLVSGSAQTCFDDQLVECHIKNALIEKNQLVHAVPNSDDSKSSSLNPLNSVSIACGTSVFEVHMRMPTWAAQVLKHLAPEVSYRSLVTLGIASVQGTSVASFEKEDADHLLFFCRRKGMDFVSGDNAGSCLSRWSSSLINGRSMSGLESSPVMFGHAVVEHGLACNSADQVKIRLRANIAAMRPIPQSRKHKLLPYLGVSLADVHDGSQVQNNLSQASSMKHNSLPPAPAIQRKSTSSSLHAQHIIPLNPLPLKKHGCNRLSMQVCSEEEFLKDVMQFLIRRGHNRLVPSGGISEFPDAILNAKRLDLYNLYREVVSRGGFYVGNGINWKGQVFSKMRNHTATNRMTGVGNTLKRHYETYLLEYELAHDDVDGECCLLCHSSAPGDWLNCGLCGVWAHLGCDRRPGLATFKDYAKTDGLEYICPHCTVANYKKKSQKMANGYLNRYGSEVDILWRIIQTTRFASLAGSWYLVMPLGFGSKVYLTKFHSSTPDL